MSLDEDLLESTEPQLAELAAQFEESTGVDRRHFLFYSLVTAAATPVSA